MIRAGAGLPCDPRGGRPMREWVRLVASDAGAAAAHVREARAFVASGDRRGT